MRGLETKRSIAAMTGAGLVLTAASGYELSRTVRASENATSGVQGLRLSKPMLDMGFTAESFGPGAIFADHLAGLNTDKHSYRHCTMVVARNGDREQLDFYEAPSMDRWNITSDDVRSVDVVVSDSEGMDGKIVVIPLTRISSSDEEGNMTKSVFSVITGVNLSNKRLIFRVRNSADEMHIVPTST